MEDLTAAFCYKAPDLPRTRSVSSMESEATQNQSFSLQNIWTPDGFDGSAASFLADILKNSFTTTPHEGTSMSAAAPPSSPCNGGPSGDLLWVNEYVNKYGPSSQHTTMSLNSGYGASSVDNWAGKKILLGHRTITSHTPRRSSHMLNWGLYNNGMASRRAFDCNLNISHQPSPSRSISAFLDKENDFEALEHSDILLFGRTKSGSLSLQEALSWNNLKVTNKIFEGVTRHVFDLMTNPYGHYLFIKLIESCNEDQLQRIIVNVTAQYDLFCYASISQHGSQSIKKLITLLAGSPLISCVVIALCSRIKEIMNNRIGSSVVMLCLETLDDEQKKLLYEAVINNFQGVAVNRNGCLSFNELINNVRGPFRQKLLNLVTDHAAFLSMDPLGNFIVQHAMKLHNPDLTEKICSELQGKYVELSMLKCGSHLVEQCLKSRGMARYAVVDFLRSSNQQLLKVARHKYGNFVIQTALKVTKSEHKSLHQDLLLKLRGLRGLHFGFGKNVYNVIVNGVPVEHDMFLK